MSDKLKRPKLKTEYERMVELVGEDAIVKPPSNASWILVGVIWMIFIIMLSICIFII